MKVRVEFDVSPAEARAFLGLPDVTSLQEEMLAKVREGIASGTAGVDALSLMRPFLAPNIQTMEGWQRAFWKAFTQQGGVSDDDADSQDLEKSRD